MRQNSLFHLRKKEEPAYFSQEPQKEVFPKKNNLHSIIEEPYEEFFFTY